MNEEKSCENCGNLMDNGSCPLDEISCDKSMAKWIPQQETAKMNEEKRSCANCARYPSIACKERCGSDFLVWIPQQETAKMEVKKSCNNCGTTCISGSMNRLLCLDNNLCDWTPEIKIEKYKVETVNKTEIEIQGTPQMAVIILREDKFSSCNFSGLSKIYDLSDWKFLNFVSGKILELTVKRGIVCL